LAVATGDVAGLELVDGAIGLVLDDEDPLALDGFAAGW
jgi:hypothetical protein